MKHATIKIGEFTVPLVGVAETVILETCDCCHHGFGIQHVELVGTQFLCAHCRAAVLVATTTNQTRPTPDSRV